MTIPGAGPRSAHAPVTVIGERDFAAWVLS
jgi:hypothetical protein